MNEPKPMSGAAKIYLAIVFAACATILATAAYQWSSQNPFYFLSFLGLALLGATRKIRMPGMTATMSLTFLFVLVSVVEFSFSESVFMATLAALMQSLWRPAKRPRPLQVAFAAATMACSAGATHIGTQWVLSSTPAAPLAVMLLLATFSLLLLNTGLVAGVIRLVEGADLLATWRHSYTIAFPYFVVGGALAGIICLAESSMGWQSSLLLLPLSYLLYLFYNLHVNHRDYARPIGD